MIQEAVSRICRGISDFRFQSAPSYQGLGSRYSCRFTLTPAVPVVVFGLAIIGCGGLVSTVLAQGEGVAPLSVDKRAYTLFCPALPELMRPLSADQPDFTGRLVTVGAGHAQIVLSFVDHRIDTGDKWVHTVSDAMPFVAEGVGVSVLAVHHFRKAGDFGYGQRDHYLHLHDFNLRGSGTFIR